MAYKLKYDADKQTAKLFDGRKKITELAEVTDQEFEALELRFEDVNDEDLRDPEVEPSAEDWLQENLDEIRDQEQEDEQELRSMRVPEKYRQKYGPEQHCGDDIATTLRDYCHVLDNPPEGSKRKPKPVVSRAALLTVCQDNDIDPSNWEHLNNGQFRMNLGNVLRGRHRRGEAVKIGDRTWAEDPAKQEEVSAKRKANKSKNKPAKQDDENESV